MELNETEQVVRKNVAVIHAPGQLSFLARKIFNVFLLNSYEELRDKRVHKLSVEVAKELTGYDSNDLKPIKAAIDQLISTKIEWSVLDSNQEEDEWVNTRYLSGGKIRRGMIYYEFSEFLTEKLHDPLVYANISIAVQRSLSGGHALSLYENCVRYRPRPGFPGGTGEWSLEQFRQLMGVDDKKLYSTFKRLNERLIKPAVADVNGHTNIRVTPVFVRKDQGRGYRGIRFEVENNPQLTLLDQVEHEEIRQTEIYKKLIDMGIEAVQALQWFTEYGEPYLAEKTTYVERQLQKDPDSVRNVGGYLTTAVKKDWKGSPGGKLAKKKKAGARAKKAKAVEAQVETQKQQQEETVAAIDAYLADLSPTDRKELEAACFAAKVQGNEIFEAKFKATGFDGFLGFVLRNFVAVDRLGIDP